MGDLSDYVLGVLCHVAVVSGMSVTAMLTEQHNSSLSPRLTQRWTSVSPMIVVSGLLPVVVGAGRGGKVGCRGGWS